MTRLALSDVLIRSLKLPNQGRREIVDQKCPGLVLRVSASGQLSWSVRYRPKGKGRVERLSIGRFPAVGLAKAREIARIKQVTVAAGGDPRAEARRQRLEEITALSVDELFDRFIAEYVSKRTPRSESGVKSYLKAARHKWRGRKARDIDRAEVLSFLKERAENTPASSNRTRSILIRAFGWAVDEGLLLISPMVRIPRYGMEKARERVLTDEELPIIWHAFDSLTGSMPYAFRLLALLGQRPGEIIGLRRGEIHDLHNPSSARIEFPPERTKNKRRHVVPLTETARRVIVTAIGTQSDGVPSTYVFTSARNPDRPYDVRSFARAMKRIVASLKNDGKSDQILSHLKADRPTPHDLRRTMTTGLSRIGVSREIRKAVINHSEGDVMEVYDRYEKLVEKRAALEAWETHLLLSIGKRPSHSNIKMLRSA